MVCVLPLLCVVVVVMRCPCVLLFMSVVLVVCVAVVARWCWCVLLLCVVGVYYGCCEVVVC